MGDTTRPELLQVIQRAFAERVGPFDRKMSEAWEEFFAVYNGLLQKFATRLHCPGDIIEDVVAAVWMDVLRCLPEFEYDRSRGGFRRWLCRLVKCRMIDELRKRHRRLAVIRDGLDTNFWQNCRGRGSATPADELESAFEQEMAKIVLTKYQQRAPEKERQVVLLCLVEGKKATQAAERLGMSADAIRQSLRRGKLRIRMIAAELFGGEGDSDPPCARG